MAKKVKMQTNKKIEQICPVCGNKSKLTLHHILPRFIFKKIKTDDRKFFLNGANSYWLCRKCHDRYESGVKNLKSELLKEFSFPEESISSTIIDVEERKIKNLCRFMSGKFPVNIYNYSIYEAYNYVKNFYNKSYLAYDEILHLSNLNDVKPNEKYINIGSFLIEKIGVEELDKIFRKDLRKFLQKRNISQLKVVAERNKYYEV